ncbi:hypothetical protein F383_37217 [Gossypium arboreum]|uniref:Uncharacterized protein n=1 Tax=Gossypium arboreum TaxID=29729 RepID=A0A0B0MB08_GOSAR|nr:hypothetical protein F383_37217 [Gossypium arboreum]
MQSHIDKSMPLSKLGLTRINYNVITYRCQRPRRGLTREHISKSYVMTYVS